jgi:hypothetical protein
MAELALATGPFDSVVATVLWANSYGQHFRLARTGPSGVEAAVRGYDPYVIPDGTNTIIARDYEAPLGVPLTYRAWTDENLDPVTGEIVVPSSESDDPWLVDLVRPTNSQRVVVQALPELAHDAPAGIHWVLNRRTPIFAGDVAHTPTLELTFVTADEPARERARATLGNGVPVLLRTPPEQGVGNLYLAVPSWREQRISRLSLHPDRRFVVTAAQVARPDPSLYVPIPPMTYQRLRETHDTYADVKAAYATYDALLYDYNAAVGPADVQPWPPSDV